MTKSGIRENTRVRFCLFVLCYCVYKVDRTHAQIFPLDHDIFAGMAKSLFEDPFPAQGQQNPVSNQQGPSQLGQPASSQQGPPQLGQPASNQQRPPQLSQPAKNQQGPSQLGQAASNQQGSPQLGQPASNQQGPPQLGQPASNQQGPSLLGQPWQMGAPNTQPNQGPQGLLGNRPGQGIPTYDDIIDFIRQKYRQLFPQAGSPLPPDTAPLFPLPNLTSIAQKCPKHGFFYSFSPLHMDAIGDVKSILRTANSTTQMLDIAKSLQRNPDINSRLWYYALATMVNEHPDLQSIHRVSPVAVIPDIFINVETLRRARQNSRRRKRQGQSCITLDENAGADNGVENQLWYFRESIPVNAHHWYYHTMYPFSSNTRGDRHGELFYYMHASLVARYNAERLSNGLARVQPFSPLQAGTPLQGYNPHLQDDNSGLSWTPRVSNLQLQDAYHQNDPNIGSNILINSQILTARNRIIQSINDGFITTSRNQRLPLNNIQGIDLLGDIVQANQWSSNPNFYGSASPSGLHNNGHLLFAVQSDPQYRTRTPPGVMADAAPAMRDVTFYSWHATMNLIFDAHKSTLSPYTATGGDLPLLWAGVQVSSLVVAPTNTGGSSNQIRTFWGQQPINLNVGLDFNQLQSRQPLSICAKQLDHEPFNYQITINKDNSVPTSSGTVRIFLAPRFDESGNRFSMLNQRPLFFVLDTFGVNLNPGANTIVRRSIDSTLTITWAQSLQEINTDLQQTTPNCGCGWPQNLLLPKGTPSGMMFDLFVMVTNGVQDAVRQTTSPPRTTCNAAPLYCGLSNQLYPDAKPMGYPFDRLPPSVGQRVVANLDEYINGISNMATAQIQIQFTGQ